MRPTFSHFRLYNPSGVTVPRSQRPDWPVHRRTSDSVCQGLGQFRLCPLHGRNEVDIRAVIFVLSTSELGAKGSELKLFDKGSTRHNFALDLKPQP